MRRLVAAALLCAAASPGLLAQSSTTAPNAAALAKYDINKNGQLDPSELAAMRADEAKSAAVPTVAAAPAAPAADDVEVMSPFQVNASSDEGYRATNTMSGTRLNTKLEDLASSITVVTKQQMQDFALLDVNDIFMYEAGTEGTATYTDFTVDRNGMVIDNVSGNPNNANRVRGIGAANQSRGSFATSGRVPLDPIDMEAVEISRGPNSSIFGLGNASGTVNIIPAKANAQRESTTTEFRVDSNGGTRGSIDVNRPIIANKLAIRANAVYQEDKFSRKPSFARTERYNGMITLRPFKYTTIRGSIQYYENMARRPNSILPRDGISYWEQSGRPSWDAFKATVTRNGVESAVIPYNSNQATETTAFGPGLESGGSGLYARSQLYVEPDGTIPYWTTGRQSGRTASTATPPNLASPDTATGNSRLVESAPPPKEGPLWAATVALTDKSRYDWDNINLAAPNWASNRVRTYTATLEQFFLSTSRHMLGMELGWNREEADNVNRNFIGQGGSSPMLIYVDVNKILPDGTANPYYLRPYINAGEPTATRNPFFRDTFRGQLAYQLTMSKNRGWTRWFGDHTLAGYGEYKNTIQVGYRYRDAITSDHTWLAPDTNRGNGSTVARGYYRFYLGDANGQNVDYAPPSWNNSWGTYNLHWYNADQAKWIDEPATIGEVYYNAGTPQRRNVIKTKGAVTQNHFLDDRIVTTFGRRKDTNLNRDSSDTGLMPDGVTPNTAANRNWPNNWKRRDGDTKTTGVAVRPFRGWTFVKRQIENGGIAGFVASSLSSINFYYNESDSFTPADVAQNLVGEQLPDPQGKSREKGIAISFFDDKLTIRYNQYKTTQVNSRAGDSGTIATRAARMDFSNTSGGSDRFNLYRNARDWVTTANPTWSEAQVATEVARQMQFPEDQLARMNAFPISDTSDVTSTGKELEATYNYKYIRTKLAVSQTQAIDNRLSPGIMAYINDRLPVWQSIIDPRTNTPWLTTNYGSSSALDFLNGSVLAPYKLAVANEGRTKSQIREWKANALGSLNLGFFGGNRILQRINVSGAVRWEDKGSIGYYTLPDDPNAFDGNHPIYDKAHTYVDAGVTYSSKIFNDRVRMRLQLNVRNLTENGRIQAIGALPNGVPYNYRIVDPRQFILTATFDL